MVNLVGKYGIAGAVVATAARYAVGVTNPVTLVALAALPVLPWASRRLSQCCFGQREPEIRVPVRSAEPAAAIVPAQQAINPPIDDEFQAALEQSRQEHEYLENLKRVIRYEENRFFRESGSPKEQSEEEFLQDLKANLKYEEDRLEQEMTSRQSGSE